MTNKEMSRALEKFIDKNENIPTDIECSNCEHEVYIGWNFKRYCKKLEELGKEKFLEYLNSDKSDIWVDDCCTCHYTTELRDSDPELNETIKTAIIDFVKTLGE